MTIPAPQTGADAPVWCGQGCERAQSVLIVRVVIIDAVAGVKQKKKFPLNSPVVEFIYFFLL